MNPVLVCCLNHRRPLNFVRLLPALRSQSVPVKIVVVDCSPGTQFAFPSTLASQVDTIITIDHSPGPPARMIPPIIFSEFEFTYFAPDDMLPGPNALAWMLDTANMLKGDFAAIGQAGVRVLGTAIHSRRPKMEPNHTTMCDYVIGGELCHTRDFIELASIRNKLTDKFDKHAQLFEHDVITGMGMSMIRRERSGKHSPCYLTPKPPNATYETDPVAVKNCSGALSARPLNRQLKQECVEQMAAIGWQSAIDDLGQLRAN